MRRDSDDDDFFALDCIDEIERKRAQAKFSNALGERGAELRMFGEKGYGEANFFFEPMSETGKLCFEV